MIVRELVTKLGFSVDDRNLKRFSSDVERLKDKLGSLAKSLEVVKKAAAGIAIAGTGLSILAVSVAKSVNAADNLARQLGVTTQDLQELELVAQSTGAEVGDLTKSFTSFNKILSSVDDESSTAAKELKELGVSIYDNNGQLKNSKDLYRDTAKSIAAIENPAKQTAKAQKLLGISNLELLDTLALSDEAYSNQLQKITKLGYVIDAQGIKTTKEFTKSWRELNIVVEGLKNQLAIKFMPVLKDVIDRFTNWYEKNKQIVNSSLDRTINIISTAFKGLLYVVNLLLSPIQYLSEALGGLDRAVIALAGGITAVLLPSIWSWVRAMSALAISILANPITWITAAVFALGAAIALLVEDIWYWVNGNDSAVGRILGTWEDFSSNFKNIISNMISYVGDFTKSVLDMLNPIKAVSKAFDKIFSSNKAPIAVQGDNPKPVGEINGLKIYKNNDLANQFTKPEPLVVRNNDIIQDAKNSMNAQGGDLSPIMRPETSPSQLMSPSRNTRNNVTQNITESITVNVPAGTSLEQQKEIADQVTAQIQEQFNQEILRGMDSLGDS